MTVEEIVKKYLIDNGYGGLCYPKIGCGCPLDDFMPCGAEGIENCQAGYKVPCPTIDEDGNEIIPEYDYFMQMEKPNPVGKERK